MITPVHSDEEYIEQAYFFRAFRERVIDGQTSQEALAHLANELLSTTKLPMAVQFLLDELRHSGLLGEATAKLPHYFTPFQALVVSQSEDESSRLTIHQGLLILEREAGYRAEAPTRAGLMIYQLETISRNRLGYSRGLKCMEKDGIFDEDWRAYIRLVRDQLGVTEFSDLVFARSAYYVLQRRQSDPDYEPGFPVLFGEKEGRIAAANRRKDPMFLFSTLQRQLGYPRVPRPPKADDDKDVVGDLQRKLANLQARLELLEAEQKGGIDLSQYYVKKDRPEDVG